ncbi:hypothetical protein Srufu_032330 [Streptomyces libani subsp. rufus]|nr:hypothetical protein Srufu_032330 [Streptomyces libani subsp. rufus]
MRHVIALDVGGTGMKAALVGVDTASSEGTPPVLLYEARRPTGRERGPEAVVEAILGFAAELRELGTARYGAPAAAAGVAVPGIVDERSGTAVYAANLGWRDVPMRALLSERLGGVPVALGHDVRTGGLAEGRIGAGRGADRFLFVPWAPGSRAPSASAAGSSPVRTAARARSATSSYGPAGGSAAAGSAAVWRRWPPPPRSAVTGPRPAAIRRPARRTRPRPWHPAMRGRTPCGSAPWTPSPTGWSPASPCSTRRR